MAEEGVNLPDCLKDLGHPYTMWSEDGAHEMTMNDHEGDGSRNDHVVRWTDFLCYVFCV